MRFPIRSVLLLSCTIGLAGCPGCPTDPSQVSLSEFIVSLSTPDRSIPCATGQTATPPAIAVDGAIVTRVNPYEFRPARVLVGWTLTTELPDVGRFDTATAQVPTWPTADRFVYQGEFHSRFFPDPEKVTRAGGNIKILVNAQVLEVSHVYVTSAELTIPVGCSASANPDPTRPLELRCQRDPRTGPAPLTVSFVAHPSGCVGPCPFRWSFGDGASDDRRRVEHVYAQPGRYQAVGTVIDDLGRAVTCNKDVEVTPPEIAPTPGPNQPPTIVDLGLIPLTDPLSRRIQAAVVDPDPGDTVAWDLAVVSGPASATLTPAAGSGMMLQSTFTASAPGTYTLRARGLDNRGGIGALDFSITVP
jgi:hypothetical protein